MNAKRQSPPLSKVNISIIIVLSVDDDLIHNRIQKKSEIHWRNGKERIAVSSRRRRATEQGAMGFYFARKSDVINTACSSVLLNIL